MREEIAIFLLEALAMPPSDAAMQAARLIDPSCTQEELTALRPLAQVWWDSLTSGFRAAEYLIRIDPNATYGTAYTRGMCACIEWALGKKGLADSTVKGALEHLRGRGAWTLSMEYRRKYPSSFTYGGKHGHTLWHRIIKLYEIVQNCGPAGEAYTFETLAECNMAHSSTVEEFCDKEDFLSPWSVIGMVVVPPQTIAVLRAEFPRIPMPFHLKEYVDAVQNDG